MFAVEAEAATETEEQIRAYNQRKESEAKQADAVVTANDADQRAKDIASSAEMAEANRRLQEDQARTAGAHADRQVHSFNIYCFQYSNKNSILFERAEQDQAAEDLNAATNTRTREEQERAIATSNLEDQLNEHHNAENNHADAARNHDQQKEEHKAAIVHNLMNIYRTPQFLYCVLCISGGSRCEGAESK